MREVLRYLDFERGVEIHHDGDLPARSGMGSSSAFTVGLLHALYALKGQMVSKQQLATESIHLEQDVLKETVGSQDQVLAAYGGLNHVRFHAERRDLGDAGHRRRRAHAGAATSHLMLFYTGIKRTAVDVARQLRRTTSTTGGASCGIMKDLVDESMSILSSEHGTSPAFGELLHEAWQAKRSLSAAVSNPRSTSSTTQPAPRARSAAS